MSDVCTETGGQTSRVERTIYLVRVCAAWLADNTPCSPTRPDPVKVIGTISNSGKTK